MGRSPFEIAGKMPLAPPLFLTSPAADYTTGELVVAHGGLLLT